MRITICGVKVPTTLIFKSLQQPMQDHYKPGNQAPRRIQFGINKDPRFYGIVRDHCVSVS
jgi:hypothetical protein